MFSPGRIVPILFPVTLAALLATLPAPAAPLTLTAGSEWAPWEHSPEIEPDGVFDLSRYVTPDAPAGCHGPLIVTPDGHFAFAEAPARRVRLRGVNLCFGALYLEKEEADRLAERLARSGYNTVRFHHYDGLLVRRGGKSWELDLQKLDQLDYLFAAMKKRGLAINIDLFSTRGFHPDEIAGFGIDASKKGRRMKFIFKGLVHISEPAFQSWARFARNLLSHKNPYTGLTWAEDPALVGICPVNEDSPYARVAREPDLRPRYEKAFADWRSRPENRDAIPPCETGPQREAAFNRFIFEESIRSDARMTAFLRSLGTRALITGSNHRVAQGLTYVREHYDFVDNHQYWDHPKFPKTSWQLPFAYHQGSAITGFANSATPPSEASAGAGWVPLGIAPSRIAGKPFVITEFNYVRPNRYRAEGGVLMPAFAGLQDWDALYNFEYAMTRRDAMNGGVENPFSLVCDPVGLIADRLSTLLFLRGDIAPARNLVVYAVQPDEAFADRNQSFPAAFRHLGLITRIASRTGSPSAVLAATRADAIVTGDMRPPPPPPLPLPPFFSALPGLADNLQRAGILPPGSIETGGVRYRSDTGEIEMRTDTGTMKVVTPRSELFVLPSAARLEGQRVSVRNGDTFSTVSVVSLDDLPLAQTRRLLVAHLTDALPSGMRFSDETRTLMEAWGKLPHLAHRGSALLDLTLPEGDWHAWTVDATGKQVREYPVARAPGGAWTLDVSTVSPEGARFLYELVR